MPILFRVNEFRNIKVSGKGVIEGDGSAWWTAFRANRSIKRGCLIRFDNCRNIEICGIRLQNAPECTHNVRTRKFGYNGEGHYD